MADKDKALEVALTQIEKQFGKGAIMRLGEHGYQRISSIPTGSIALDIALGIGGVPRGRIIEVFGTESSGKTTIALHIIAEAQRAGGIAAFIDAEHALDPTYAAALGVNLDDLLISQPDTGEQGLEIADTLVRSSAIDLIVIDSVAALVPRAEIEGEMGDTHVGLQARLMSQALRKLSGNLSKSNTCMVFINQLREKIGVMFGCFSYGTRVTLADGTQERIGKIVNQKMPVEVLSYNFEAGKIVPRKVMNWFKNGKTDQFLQFTVTKPTGNGKAQFAATANHKIRTPAGWKEAQELVVGDRVLIATERRLSDFQWEILRGSLMGDGALSKRIRREAGDVAGVRFRMGHGSAQIPYLEWKSSLFANIPMSRTTDERGAGFIDMTPLPELSGLRDAVYKAGRKEFADDFVKQLTPLSLSVWYMDDGHLDVRNEAGTSARIQICVQAMTPETRERLVGYLRHTWDLDVRLTTIRQKSIIVFSKEAAEEFQSLVAAFIHPSMQYKLLAQYRGRFSVQPVFSELDHELTPARILDIHTKPLTRSMERFDIEVEGSHNYFVDGVMVHNSPETTPGGRALKFYSSVRLDVRRIENLKDGAEVVGSRVRAKVVKNKTAPPFRQAEFDIMYGKGISREGSLIDVGVEQGFIKKSGAWFTYEGTQIGQGRENARQFLLDNPDVALDVEKRIRDTLGLVPQEPLDKVDEVDEDEE